MVICETAIFDNSQKPLKPYGGFMEVEIDITTRTAAKKSEAKHIRRDGGIPIVIYAVGKNSECASLPKESFDAILRNVKPGFLPTTIFILKDQKGKKRRAIIKDIQYKVTSYDVLHLDFQELDDALKVDINVPVECLSQPDCVGVKAGGFLRFIMRHLKVRCLPKDIPSHFEIDVKDLDIRQVRRVSEIAMPAKVLPLAKPQDIVVTVVKR